MAVYSRTGTANSQNKVRYLLDDPQDSVVSILDSAGAVVVNESYTAYGNRRNPDTWSGAPTNAQKTAIANVTRQGYTWQTALGDMGLNHMNGRVQDAVTGTFLSADLVISDPDDPQNYNLYSYVLNNPMSFTDPSGYCPNNNASSLVQNLLGFIPGYDVLRCASSGCGALGWAGAGISLIAPEAKVLQTGGKILAKSTAKALNKFLGKNLHEREWGRALEDLKKYAGKRRNDAHGKIKENGDVHAPNGDYIGNLGDHIK